jgi:hypothetical protein
MVRKTSSERRCSGEKAKKLSSKLTQSRRQQTRKKQAFGFLRTWQHVSVCWPKAKCSRKRTSRTTFAVCWAIIVSCLGLLKPVRTAERRTNKSQKTKEGIECYGRRANLKREEQGKRYSVTLANA